MEKKIRKNQKKKGYFYEEQEQAVVDFLNETDPIIKNQIFSEKLWEPITTMVESIIRRYKLFVPDEVYEDTFYDTISFLMTKLDKFEPGKYKAYSYYGTICKNYLIGKIQNFTKTQERNPLYGDVAGGFNKLEFSSVMDVFESNVADESIQKLIDKLKSMIKEKDTIPLKENETKLGEALITLFENWDYILTTDGSPKLNKSAILLFLKDNTGLDAKGIRDNIKKFKKEFKIIKGGLLD
jgi:hypothetical protein